MKFAFDVDGVLTKKDVCKDDYLTISKEEATDRYANAIPNYDMIDKVNELYDQGHEILIWTARPSIKFSQITTHWLRLYGVRYSEIIFNKMYFDLLIDDKTENNLKGLEEFLKKNDICH